MRLSFVPVALLAGLASAQQLDLTVSPDGSFAITHDGNSWLSGGAEYQAGGFSKAAGTLQVIGAPAAGSGTDALGDYNDDIHHLKNGSTAAFKVRCTYPAYLGGPGYLGEGAKPFYLPLRALTVGGVPNKYLCPLCI